MCTFILYGLWPPFRPLTLLSFPPSGRCLPHCLSRKLNSSLMYMVQSTSSSRGSLISFLLLWIKHFSWTPVTLDFLRFILLTLTLKAITNRYTLKCTLAIMPLILTSFQWYATPSQIIALSSIIHNFLDLDVISHSTFSLLSREEKAVVGNNRLEAAITS